jgi:hypothetical protein
MEDFVPSAQSGSSQVNPMVLVMLVFFLIIVIAAVDHDHARRAENHRAA